jgi:cell division septation protein DedD
VNLRNLEDIQENDARSGGFPLGTLFLAAIAGGALVVVVMMGLERKVAPTQNHGDPLEELVSSARKTPPHSAMTVEERQVTFPQILSDRNAPTTALAVVKDERGRLRESDNALAPDLSEPEVAPPEANDKLPNRVLPAGDLLSRTTVTEAPKDDLTQIAKQQTSGSDSAEMAPMGFEGGFEIQVASFRESGDADNFVTELRKRGHRAYRQAAYVPERGLWHRVRVGPFKSRYEAQNYQQKLESAERLSTFLVDPDKVKRQEEIREAKEKARDEKAERQKKRLESARLSPKP